MKTTHSWGDRRRKNLWRWWKRGLRFSVTSCNKPTSIFADSRETFAWRDVIEDIVIHQSMTEEVGEGAEVV